MSNKIDFAVDPLNARIALRLQSLRSAQGLSLDVLASRSGVSRSMISLIERGKSSPTAVVLDKLATGLGITLASLFDSSELTGAPVVRLQDQVVWQDPQSGYQRRNVSPPGFASPIQMVEVEFPAGATVHFEAATREPRVHQQVWLLDGAIRITVGNDRYDLATGDCLALVLEHSTTFYNPHRKAARYAVVLSNAVPQGR